MLLNVGLASRGDFGEQSLVGKFLLSLIFNEYSSVNQPDARAFRAFARQCLGLPVSADAMAKATASVEFQGNRCGAGGDNTTFDALLTLDQSWVWGIEAKYCDYLTTEQIRRELAAIGSLRQELRFAECGLLFLAPEQYLGYLVCERGEIAQCLRDPMNTTTLRLASWEMVLSLLAEAGGAQLREELKAYCEHRNTNTPYPIKLSLQPVVATAGQWADILADRVPAPPNLPREMVTGNFQGFGKASSTVDEVLRHHCVPLAEQIIRLSDLEQKAQASGYINLSSATRACAQLHPHPEGLALVIPDADERVPHFSVLRTIPVETLAGYHGTNRSWLDGRGKFTTRPAIAFLIPEELAGRHDHPGWGELKALLKYARTRSRADRTRQKVEAGESLSGSL